jgi:hypothetical protein
LPQPRHGVREDADAHREREHLTWLAGRHWGSSRRRQ